MENSKTMSVCSPDDACQILDPIQSPITHGYRTKCEFTIGKNIQGERTVGFLLGQYRDGVTAVLEPYDCLHVSDNAKEIVRAMEVIILCSSLCF